MMGKEAPITDSFEKYVSLLKKGEIELPQKLAQWIF